MTEAPTHGVLFDVGYGLCDEGDRLGVAIQRLTAHLASCGVALSADALHAQYRRVCATPDVGGGSLLVMAMVAAGVAEATARAARKAVAWDDQPLTLLPGALEALRTLRGAGLRLGVLANQPASARDDLRKLGVEPLLDDIWLSDAVGLHKPDPAFFQLALDTWELPAGRVAYVGDRPDNDIGPAKRLGLYTVRLRVGPHADQPATGAGQVADAEAASLGEAAGVLGRWCDPG